MKMKKKKITVPLTKNSSLSKEHYYIRSKVYYRIVEFFKIGTVNLLLLDYYKNKEWLRKTLLVKRKDFIKHFKRIKYEN